LLTRRTWRGDAGYDAARSRVRRTAQLRILDCAALSFTSPLVGPRRLVAVQHVSRFLAEGVDTRMIDEFDRRAPFGTRGRIADRLSRAVHAPARRAARHCAEADGGAACRGLAYPPCPTRKAAFCAAGCRARGLLCFAKILCSQSGRRCQVSGSLTRSGRLV